MRLLSGRSSVIGELLRNTGDFMRSRCEETCKTVFAYRSHRHLLVQKAAIQLLPQLALFYPDHFTQQWLEPCMAHLVSVLKAAGDHYGVAFAAVGEISLAVGQAIMPYTPQIIELVNMALPSQAKWRKQGADNTNEALRCVSKLAKAVGPSLAPQIETLVDQMFEAGLSQPLLDVLGDLARSTPSLLPAVQTKLLSCIASVLTVPQRADAAPGDEAAEALALAALGCFGAGDPRARDVVSTAVVQYFDHPTAAIRREAALTVTRLLLPSREHAAAGAPGGAPQWAGAEHGGGLGHDGAPAAQRASRAHGFSQRVVLCRTHQLTAVAGLLRHTLMFAASEPDKVTRERVSRASTRATTRSYASRAACRSWRRPCTTRPCPSARPWRASWAAWSATTPRTWCPRCGGFCSGS
ncbi:unnamed protein product [Prorocentrum cordatum]|uniref:Serine/threonine-protein kinase TOR n=1 Tax=Prorocentrum cordatum TaxID=2364126 RepID=A0ABN9UJX2_9DINO|nr:unnamed protein product [Polarella glacialis]